MFAPPASPGAFTPPNTLGTLTRETRHDAVYGVTLYTDSLTGTKYVGRTSDLPATATAAELEAIVRRWRSPP